MTSKLVLLALSVLCLSCIAPELNMPAHASSPIMISMDSYPQVNIVIYAPDFNSNPYAIDTIGEDGSTVVISTRESSIPYRLVETGPDTGYFAGSVIVSSTTSSCSPVCGPNDGFLAGGGNDAITVSFTYANGQTITASSNDGIPRSVYHGTVPEFPIAGIALVAGLVFLVCFSRMNFIR